MTSTHARELTAEFFGTAVLLVAVVGSGIVTSQDGVASAQLFQHAVAVGAALTALILAFGPVSGAHLNPAVTAVDWWFGGLTARRAAGYVAAQLGGAVAGSLATNAMFGTDVLTLSGKARDGLGMVGSEALATGGLLLVIFALVRTRRLAAVPGAVGAWIGAAIFFTPSASFANPAVTVARMLTDTWTGIAPASVPGFLLGQALGALAAGALIGWLYRPSEQEARDVVVPHGPEHLEPDPVSTDGGPP